MRTLIFLLALSSSAFASASTPCPKMTLKGFTSSEKDGKTLYVNEKQTLTFAFNCLPDLSKVDAKATIDLFPNVKVVNDSISFQELSSGTDAVAKIYFDTRKGMNQMALVAKLTGDKEKVDVDKKAIEALDAMNAAR